LAVIPKSLVVVHLDHAAVFQLLHESTRSSSVF
jgi:hypothetical protein